MRNPEKDWDRQWKSCPPAMCKAKQANRKACCWGGGNENLEKAKAVL